MKGEISKEGNLKIMRGNKMVYQNCPKTIETGQVQPYNPCGDWCPLFGEPSHCEIFEGTQLDICEDRSLYFNEFTDHRQQTEGNKKELDNE